jgi:5-methylcytosine-specific restriction enzyme subunit McrC
VFCRFDQLSHDIPEYRLARFALTLLIPYVTDSQIASKGKLATNLFDISGVSEISSSAYHATRKSIVSNVRDSRLIELTKLALDCFIPNQNIENSSLYEVEKKIEWLRTLFEKAIRGFYSYHLEPLGWQVGSRKMKWDISSPSENFEKLLPGMQSDIELKNPQRDKKIIIDTKFNPITVSGSWENESIRSGYIYQMYAYMRSQEETETELKEPTSGILLHPATGTNVFEEAHIQGHRLIFATVDLMQSQSKIKENLLNLIAK